MLDITSDIEAIAMSLYHITVTMSRASAIAIIVQSWWKPNYIVLQHGNQTLGV